MSDPPAKPEGSYRLVHTADWHMGKLLGDLNREEEHGRFLSFLLELIETAEVDGLIIAGDVFDSPNPSQRAQSRYFNFLHTLRRRTECCVVVVAGNHDSPALIDAPGNLLRSLKVQVVGGVPENTGSAVLSLPEAENPAVLVAAIPFLRDRDVRTGQIGQNAKEIQHSLVSGIQRRYEEAAEAATAISGGRIPVIATGHLTVTGASTSDSEREIHIGGLGSVSADLFPETFDYVALGHLHRPQSAGHRETVRYSGSPIPLSFSEATDVKSVELIDCLPGSEVSFRSIEIPAERRLVQLKCHRSELLEKLEEFDPPSGPLTTWVEILVESPIPGENLFEVIQDATADCSYSVVRVVSKQEGTSKGLRKDDDATIDLDESILDQPDRVFAVRLDQAAELSDNDKSTLKTAFQELLELHRNNERESAVAAKGGKK